MIETPSQILEHNASADAVRGFIAWRKLTKAPLTERAAVLIAKSLREITADGGDADEALDMTQERGWRTVKPAWYWRAKADERNHNTRSLPQGQQNRADPAIEQISRLARLGTTPGNGRG